MGLYKYPRTYPCPTVTYSVKKDGNKQLSAHFQVKEFQSKDGADTVVICPDLINKCLEPLFKAMNAKAINITSGYRTVKHSLAIGGSGTNDNHHLGMAADIKVKKQNGTYYSAKEVACALQDLGWKGGIGLMATSVHTDTGSQYWFDETKKTNGAYVQVADWHSYTGIAAPTTSKPVATKADVYIITCLAIRVRTEPSTKTGKYVRMMYRGAEFTPLAWKGDWAQLSANEWICIKKYCKKKNT